MNWWQALLLGMGIGLPLIPVLYFTAKLIGNFLLKVKIKRLIKNKEFLMPIDSRDFDVEKWKDLIPIKEGEIEAINKIFNKEKPKP